MLHRPELLGTDVVLRPQIIAMVTISAIQVVFFECFILLSKRIWDHVGKAKDEKEF
jgi:hypothetical protein